MPPPTPEQIAALEKAARQAARHSYSPYSGFAVGAALLDAGGAISAGCNVENASYGLTICAERAALCQAVVRGHRRFTALLLYTPTATPTVPCGACRQALLEFVRDLPVIAVCDGPGRWTASLADLLPQAFALAEPGDTPHE
jgi:cytidine deaminase